MRTKRKPMSSGPGYVALTGSNRGIRASGRGPMSENGSPLTTIGPTRRREKIQRGAVTTVHHLHRLKVRTGGAGSAYGRPAGTRTPNPLIKSHELCRLFSTLKAPFLAKL